MYLIDYNRVIRINIINDFDFMCRTCTPKMRDNMFSCHSGLNKISISSVEKKSGFDCIANKRALAQNP